MKTLREEIDRRLASNQVYYAHFVTHTDIQIIRKQTTKDIIEIIEKRIDKLIELHRKDKFGYFKVGEYDKAQSHLISQTFWKEVKELLK